MTEPKIRLYVGQPLAMGQALAATEAQANYLFNVMRLGPGDRLRVFDGLSGEFIARVEKAGKRAGILVVEQQSRPMTAPPDLWLVFAPIKRARLDFLVEKAVELGAARLVPVLTRFTNAERLREDKLRAHVIEAAEQCEAVHLPDIKAPVPLPRLLQDWPADRALIWADEALARAANLGASSGAKAALPLGPAAILIGPEGGFAPEERALIAAHPAAHPIALGPRILRAETAAIAALTLWQAQRGDWGGDWGGDLS